MRQLFHRAQELTTEEREIFLAAECAAEEGALRAEVLALLGAAEQAGDFLESCAADAVPEIEALLLTLPQFLGLLLMTLL